VPEDLLQLLETAAPVTVSLDNSGDLPRIVARDLACAVEGRKGSALLYENAWRRIVLEAANGQTTEIQAARPLLLSALERRLAQLKEAHALASWLAKLSRKDGPDPAILLPEIAA
jgi:hypothetical protein